jgi:type III restriction enzyme
MANFEVETPILNTPFEEPTRYWQIEEGKPAERMQGRRPAGYYYRSPKAPDEGEHAARGEWRELALVNLIRERMAEWRAAGRPGITRTTRELIDYWNREGRHPRLFFAQREAAEAIVFLTEARADFLQGISAPLDEPSDDRQAAGYKAFHRLCCKMATGSGKTTVMGMLASWSILNKVNDRSDARFSDVVLVVCPDVTIRSRLGELDPQRGGASLYRTRDLIPERLMPDLTRGRVLVTNWHVFEPQGLQIGGVSAKVNRSGVPVRIRETIAIAAKTTSMRGTRYLTLAELDRQVAAGLLTVIEEQRDRQGNLKKVEIEAVRYIESDTALVKRVLGGEVGGKQNILVLNDEAHHAYRIQRADAEEEEDGEEDADGGMEDEDYFVREATVWVDGLDRINKLRGINFCIDLSATPYFIGRAGAATNTVFPWVVSDFGLTDAIEAGLVKIPQLAVRDTTGAEIPGYFNIWRWILPRLTPAERGGKKGNPKPEAILKWANTPIAMLGGLWDELRREWSELAHDNRPPVFILVCKNTRIAKVIYDWLAEDKPPTGIPPAKLDALRNTADRTATIRVDTKVVQESDTEGAKSDEVAWMRLTLDTVGRLDWPQASQGRPIYSEGFEELARKLVRPLHPPGRDIRCIVSVAMLTEGWDCNTVTHIIGLRPFMSQLLCEQVVGRALRRRNYDDFDEDGRLTEEVAKVFGVPFEVIPFKENKAGPRPPQPKRHHIHAIPEKAPFEIRFPRVEAYRQGIRNRVSVDWSSLATLRIDPKQIPPEVQVKDALAADQGRPSLHGPGAMEVVALEPFRRDRRLQELVFGMAAGLVREYMRQESCEAPAHVLFPQLARIVQRYVMQKVIPEPPADRLDVFLSPYYGWVIERLAGAIHPDTASGEVPELPIFEKNRGEGSTAEVDFWTSREVREVVRSHLNYAVADTRQWDQSATYLIDTHPAVDAFVKNAGLGFAIPYFHNGQPHDYVPDFVIRLVGDGSRYLILKTKGFDPLAEVKEQAATRWIEAVNADGQHGIWQFAMARRIGEVRDAITAASSRAGIGTGAYSGKDHSTQGAGEVGFGRSSISADLPWLATLELGNRARSTSDELITTINGLNIILKERNFELVDTIFRQRDVTKISPEMMLAFVRTTFAARSKLGEWCQLRDRVRPNCHQDAPTRILF